MFPRWRLYIFTPFINVYGAGRVAYISFMMQIIPMPFPSRELCRWMYLMYVLLPMVIRGTTPGGLHYCRCDIRSSFYAPIGNIVYLIYPRKGICCWYNVMFALGYVSLYGLLATTVKKYGMVSLF